MTKVLLSSGIRSLTMTSRPQLMLTQARSNSSVPSSLNAQTVFIIQIKCLFLFKEKKIVITVGNLQTTSIQCVGKTQSCFVSHHNTHTEALCSKGALRPRGKTFWSHCDVNRSFVIQETVIVVAEVNALSGSNSFHLRRRAVSCPFFNLLLTHAYCNLIMWNGELQDASVSRALVHVNPLSLKWRASITVHSKPVALPQ